MGNVAKAIDLVGLYPRSLYGGFKNRKLFEQVETYFMFIGYPRSGHSVIGSLLDAHPNIVCAHELGVLKYILAKFNKHQIYYLLLGNSRSFTEKGRKWSGYFYRVPNQWQGKFTELRAIADKAGSGAVLRLKARPWLLRRLRDRIGCQIKLLHITRNPYDNITTICSKHSMSLNESIEYYFYLCETVADIRRQLSHGDLFELRHEQFIAHPSASLQEICAFLGINAQKDYLRDCASIVFKSPRKTRHNTRWNSELRNMVKDRMTQFSFLEDYSFDE